MDNKALHNRYMAALNKVTRWRMVFAGWQLGTQSDKHGPTKALKHHLELSIVERIEMNALTRLLMDKGIITMEEFQEQIIIECKNLDMQYELMFPGFKTTENGIDMDPQLAVKTTRRLNFPS